MKGVSLKQIIAVTLWENRISPVFDASRSVLLIESESGQEINRSEVLFKSDSPHEKAHELSELGVHTVICGAISESYFSALESAGIHVEAFIAGEADQIVCAILKGKKINGKYCMPGCGRKRQAFRKEGI